MLFIQWKSDNSRCLCNWVDGWLLRLAMTTPVTELWTQLPTIISHLTEWESSVGTFSYVMGFHIPCVCRCGTTPWRREPRTGLMPASGSTGHLTSSGSWVKTSPSGQDGEWPLTPLPLTDICCSSQGWLSLSAVMVIALPPPSSFSERFFAQWPGDCLRNAPLTLQINKSCVFSHDPWGQKRIPLVGLDFPFGDTGYLHMFLHFEILLRNNTRLLGIQLILTIPCDSLREFYRKQID